MAGRQWRSWQQAQGIIPLRRAAQLSRTVSLWYCDFKITAFNDFVFSLGRRHRRLLRAWFSIGIGISIMAIIGTTLVLLWELVCAAYLSKYEVGNLSMNWLFGLSHFSGLSTSLMDFGIMLYSTFAAVFIHEFGHALAAASQGIQVEYVAMFLAIIFPGAFVAFNYDLLQNLTLISALRIYCAGVWHNVVLCAGCWLTLLFLPSLLHPFYVYGEGSMDESCMTPVQIPGTAWIEISFSRPYSSECLSNDRDQSSSMDLNRSTTEPDPCGGVFVFVGDPLSLINSVALSAYKPRWASGGFGLYLPTFCEKVLSWTFHVSASLALFNSLPAFFLDGESILETCILQVTFLRLRSRRRVLRLLLYGGSVLFIFASFRVVLSLYRRPI